MRFCILWAMTILANSILMLHGEAHVSWIEESQSADICKSIQSFRRLKPLGASSIVIILAAAYGISDVEMREKLKGEYQILLYRINPLPREMCGATLQLVFDILTGRRTVLKGLAG